MRIKGIGGFRDVGGQGHFSNFNLTGAKSANSASFRAI